MWPYRIRVVSMNISENKELMEPEICFIVVSGKWLVLTCRLILLKSVVSTYMSVSLSGVSG